MGIAFGPKSIGIYSFMGLSHPRGPQRVARWGAGCPRLGVGPPLAPPRPREEVYQSLWTTTRALS